MNKEIVIVEGMFDLFMKNNIDDLAQYGVIDKIERYADKMDKNSTVILVSIRIANKTEFNRKKLMGDSMYHYVLCNDRQDYQRNYLKNFNWVEELCITSLEQQVGVSFR